MFNYKLETKKKTSETSGR